MPNSTTSRTAMFAQFDAPVGIDPIVKVAKTPGSFVPAFPAVSVPFTLISDVVEFAMMPTEAGVPSTGPLAESAAPQFMRISGLAPA